MRNSNLGAQSKRVTPEQEETMLHPYRVSASFVCVFALCAAAMNASADARTEEIRKLSQQFSDASASGDKAVLAASLDDHVIFMNETGELATKQDIVDSASPPPAGMQHKLTQADWQVAFHGDVAVTSFKDISEVNVGGQHVVTNYLSTEVWQKQHGQWKMISSQTMTAPVDPAVVALPGKVLDQYVGTYRAGEHFVLTISREGDELFGQTNGGGKYALKAEMQDLLFTPGQHNLRRLIERDGEGKVVGLISRRDGHDIKFQRVES
jgi:ketosteroid isomerase-like protein